MVRGLSVGVLLLVAATAILVLSAGSFGALRGETLLAGPLFDQRALAPLARIKPTLPPAPPTANDDGVMDIRLSVWENTFSHFGPH